MSPDVGCCECAKWMTPERRKSTTIATTFVFFLLGGIEYAVILPTINGYLDSLDAGPLYLGLALSAFSLSGLLVSPVFGILHDYLRKTKSLLLFANCFEIGGNLMYFFAFSPDVLVVSRFIAGIGYGVGASMLAQIARTTPAKERSAAFALFMSVRQFGLIFGPALNLIFVGLDTHIGRCDLNDKTAPGLLMTLVWSLYQLMVFFLYYDLPFLADLVPDEDQEPKEDGVIRSQEHRTYDEATKEHNGKENNREKDASVQRPLMAGRQPASKLTGKQKVLALLREDTVIMLAVTFVFFFSLSAIETSLTPLTKRLLGFESMGNSLLFCVDGVLIIVAFVLIKIMSKRIQDRVIMTIGLMTEIVVITFFCVFLPITLKAPNPSEDWFTWFWLLGFSMVQVFGLPFIIVTSVSLLSKSVPEEIQGFSQGVRRSVVGIGSIMGPLWATGILDSPIAFSVVMAALYVLVQLMVFSSWGKLAEPRREVTLSSSGNQSGPSEPPQDRIPLLKLADKADPEE